MALTNKTKPKRDRLSMDIDAYPDVKKMLNRLREERPGVSTSFLVAESLRRDLTARGYARKND